LSKDTEFESLSYKNQRPENQWFDSQLNLLDANRNMIKSKNQPKLMLFGTGGYGQPGLNMLANSFDTYFIGGLSLKIPLSYVYSGSQKFDFEAIRLNKEKINVQKEVFDQNLKIQFENQVSEIKRLEQALKTDNEQINIKNQIKELADAQYNNGIISITELLGEITAENTSKQNKIIHEVQLQMSKNQLKSIKGTL
jgi:outer membrane protein TolC